MIGGCLLPKENQFVQKRIRELHPLVKPKTGGASRLVFTVLHLWQRKSYHKLVHRGPKPNAKLAKNIDVIEFSEWLAKRDFFDAAFWLSCAYAAWVGEQMRTEYAMYFTPPVLSSRLIDDLVTNKASLTQHVWMDPACGGAAFLAPVAHRMARALHKQDMTPKAILKHIADHLIGNDVDPILSRLSKQFLRMSLHNEIAEAKFEPEFKIESRDALSSLKHHHEKVDVVICNPPYRKMVAEEVSRLERGYGEVMVGQPNIYVPFFKLALSLLRKNCVAGLLTPTSFLSGQYFSPLRTYLLENAETLQLDIVQERGGVFVAAQLDTAITILKKGKVEKNASKETRVYVFQKGHGFATVGNCRLPNSGTSWPVPRTAEDAETIRYLNGSSFRLSHYGYQARVGSFVWNRDERKTFSTKKAALKSGAPYPLIWSSDVKKSGRFEFGRLHRKDENDIYVDMVKKNHGSIIQRPCVALQRVTSSDQSRRLIGAPVSRALMKEFGGVVGENHVVFLEKIDPKSKFSPTELAAVLRSEPIDRLFRCISGVVNVSVFELNQLPLPDPVRLKEELDRKKNVSKAVTSAFVCKKRR